MPSTDEANAGFDAAKKTILKVVDALAPNHDIPFFGNPHVKALEWLNSQAGTNALLNEVNQILAAAEAVRAKSAKAAKAT